MSPKEFKQLNTKFIPALNVKLMEKEGITAEVIGMQGPITHIRILNEVFELFNDGNRANWRFLGHMR